MGTGHSLIGRLIYGYRVDELIGTGSQGEIYRLVHPALPGRCLALKILHGQNAASHELRARFLQDAMATAKVGSAGVVQPVQIDELEDGTPYVVMELAPGASLDRILDARGPLGVRAALTIALQIATTMTRVHDCGIIHRDLKPGNVMVDLDGDNVRCVKLLDFGVARVSADIRQVKTAQGKYFGTRSYIAPETCAGDPIDGRVDVFALGVMLFEMLTGDTPFHGLVDTLSPDPAPPPSTRRPPMLDAVAPEVDALVARAIEKRQHARPTMSQLRDQIGAALDEFGGLDGATVRSTLPGFGPEEWNVDETTQRADLADFARASVEGDGRAAAASEAPRPLAPPLAAPMPMAAMMPAWPQDPPPTEPAHSNRRTDEHGVVAAAPLLPIHHVATEVFERRPAAPPAPPKAAPTAASIAPTGKVEPVDTRKQAATPGRLRSWIVTPLVALAVVAVVVPAVLVGERLLRQRREGVAPAAPAPLPDGAATKAVAAPAKQGPAPTVATRPRPAPGPATWEVIPTATREPLYDLWAGGDTVVAVGGRGTILRSTDGGASFARVATPEEGRRSALYGVWGDGEGLVIAVGERGTILRSTDGGSRFATVAHGSSTVYYGVAGSSAADLHLVGNPALILHSEDGGQIWRKQAIPTGNGLRRVFAAGPGRAWAVGWGETILHTDGGAPWRSIRAGKLITLFDLVADGETIVAVGSLHPPGSGPHRRDDAILRSTDGGRRFVLDPTPTRAPLYAVGGGAGELFVGGPAGLLLRGRGDGAWSRDEVPLPRRKLSRLLATDRALFTVGTEGLLARRGR